MSQTVADGRARMRIEPNPRRVRAMFAGHVIADTTGALTVHEQGHAPVQYFPREDVETSRLGKTDHHTRCPLKGEASYYALAMDGEIQPRAVWSYEDPLEGAEALRGYMAFDPRWTEVYQLTPAEMAAAPRALHAH
jgi:uncharacterized protein (DUF427 family)